MDSYATCPYRGIDRVRRWDQSISAVSPEDIDLGVIGIPPKLDHLTKIGSAGSCFAQRIAETLKPLGYTFIDKEPAPEWLAPERRKEYGFGVYSARFGNVYSALQLTQLMERSFGRYLPSDEFWESNKRFFDPFRPGITPNGYSSLREASADRLNHLKAVKSMFEELDCFIFTLGLTEAWIRNEDGAVLPVCPGCGVGEFDPQKYSFVNFTVPQVVDHLKRFMGLLSAVNPDANVILTVSPVPLAATMEMHSVLLSTSLSKAVLRIAAQEIINEFPNACYFPSYELVTQTRNSYFERDGRGVTKEGVAHVMRSFFKNFSDETHLPSEKVNEAALTAATQLVTCDENELALALARRM